MSISPFAWLRRKTAESIALGVADGLAAVTPEGEEAAPVDLAGLRQLAARQLPAKELPAAEESKKGGKKP